jgi:hypothetical protein
MFVHAKLAMSWTVVAIILQGCRRVDVDITHSMVQAPGIEAHGNHRCSDPDPAPSTRPSSGEQTHVDNMLGHSMGAADATQCIVVAKLTMSGNAAAIILQGCRRVHDDITH